MRVAPGAGANSGAADVPDRARLSLRIVGRLTLRVGQNEVAALSRKSRALLGYLALTEAGEETRERLVGLLWSEVPEDRARASLRQALHEIRDAMSQAGFDGVTGDKHALRLDRSRVDVDFWDLFDRAAAGHAHPVLLQTERPMERLLDELDAVDPAFRVWLLAKRQALGDRLTRFIETAMRDKSRPAADREGLARALRNLDPTHEEAARVLIGVRAGAGDIGGALNVYKALWDLLDQEYDVEPSRETQELIAAVKLGRPLAERVAGAERPGGAKPAVPVVIRPEPAGAAPAATQRWPKLMVSVAGFDGAATKPEHRYLVDGFRRELIACLIRFREWVVRDATLSAAVPASGADSAEYIVEASAFETCTDALRLVITLRDLSTSAYLWSERLNVSVASWFEAQQLVVRRITTALNVHLSAERLVAVGHRPVGDLKAYDAWLLGQATFLSFDIKNWDRARTLFQRVIAQMPEFAPAYSSLAQLNNSEHIVKPGVFRDLKRSEQSLMYAREAARLDPIDSRSQLCLGWSYAAVMQYEQAMIYIPLAYELNDNDPWTLVSAAWGFAACGQYERATELAAHTLRLPLVPSPLQWSYHTAIRFIAGDYIGCVQAAAAAGEISLSALGYKVAALGHLGNRQAAASELQRYYQAVRSRWIGDEPASEANIARWLLHMAPIKRVEDWQRLQKGLAIAGAPVEGLVHEGW
jgi:DNA-binding SARP family transcriptional activator/TolB-like protein